MVPAIETSVLHARRRNTGGPWLGTQTVIVLGAIGAYFGVRHLTEGRPEVAAANAERLMWIERVLGLDCELGLQGLVVGCRPITTILSWIYIYGHWPVIAATLIWLAVRHPATFLCVRNAMLLSGAVGLVVFAAVPVAPPRLVGVGFVDTVTEQAGAYRVLQPPAFTNQFAALPSLHVGWNLLIGLAIVAAARHALVRAVGWLMPVAMAAAVVLTANHYFVDVLAGALLTGLAWLAVRRRNDWRPPAGVPQP